MSMNPCEKETEGTIRRQDASSGLRDSAGHVHWYCAKHFWQPSPAIGEGALRLALGSVKASWTGVLLWWKEAD